MNTFRGLVAVIAGLAVWTVLLRMLETALVNVLAQQPLGTLETSAVVAASPVMIVSRLGYTAAVAIMSGHITARIAAHDPMRYTTVGAVFQIVVLIAGFAAGLGPTMPLWTRVALVGVSAGGTLMGGALRAAAAGISASRRDE